jgi:hypothetical protein
MMTDVMDLAAGHAVLATHPTKTECSSWCWSLMTDTSSMPSRCIERITSASWLRTEAPIVSVCVPELVTQLEELREHDRVFGTMLSALKAAFAGPLAGPVREQHAQLLRGRARTRSAIKRTMAELSAQRVRRLLATCAARGTALPRQRRAAVRSACNARSLSRARRAVHVARAATKATGDPDPDPEPPGRAPHPVHRTGCAVSGDNTKNTSTPSARFALEHARHVIELRPDRGGRKRSAQSDGGTSQELLEDGTFAYYISVSDGRLSQGHDVYHAVDACRSTGSGASSSTGPATGVPARAQDPRRETRAGWADRRVRRRGRGTPRATVGSWPESS